jgi:probable phosphomutase (TIGR03848 family)
MLLFLIRHAVTAHTGELLTGWMPGVHLSEQGREEARAMAERMAPVKLAAVYSSPVDRALETAKVLASSKGLRVRVREGIGEVRYGEWEGRRLATIAKTRQWRRVVSRPGDIRFPGGETIRETQCRALDAIAQIAEENPGKAAAAVSHADVIKLVIAYYAGIPLELYARIGIAPASVSALSIGAGPPRMVKVNDTGSLSDLVTQRRIRVRGRR